MDAIDCCSEGEVLDRGLCFYLWRVLWERDFLRNPIGIYVYGEPIDFVGLHPPGSPS